MFNLFNLMGSSTTVAPWISESFPIIRVVLVSLILVFSVAIIILVLKTNSAGVNGNAVTGQTESYYMANKGSTKAGRHAKLLTIFSISIAVLALLYFVSYIVYPAT